MGKFKPGILNDIINDDDRQLVESMKEAITEEAPKGRKTYSEEEVAGMIDRKASGKKEKLPRINLGFTPENLLYVKIMSKVKGETQSDFINHVLEQSRAENAEVYEKAKELAMEIRKSI